MMRIRYKTIFSVITIIFLCVVVVVLARATWGAYQKSQFAKENRDRAEQELTDLQLREAALREDLDHLETDRGLEEVIRHTFDVGNEGEQLIVLVDAPDPEPAAPAPEPTLWEKILGIFGKE